MPSFGKISRVCFIKRALEYIVGTKDAKPNEDYLLFTNIKVLVKPFHLMQLPKAKKTFY